MTLEEARNRNAIVRAALADGGSLVAVVGALVEALEAQEREIIRLSYIVPAKVVVGSETFIWRCPPDLIPETMRVDATPPTT